MNIKLITFGLFLDNLGGVGNAAGGGLDTSRISSENSTTFWGRIRDEVVSIVNYKLYLIGYIITNF